MSRKAAAALAVGLVFGAPAGAADSSPNLWSGVHELGPIEAMRRLPAQGFQVVQIGERVVLVSLNGHYAVVGGRIMDLWNGVEIRSVADVDKTLRMPLKKLGVPLEELGTLVLGEGPDVVVFFDPLAPTTPAVLARAREVSQTYRVHLVILPAREDRKEISRRLLCLDTDAALAILDRLAFAEVPNADETCGLDKLQRNLVSAGILGLTEIPLTVAPNGATLKGLPEDYLGYLDRNRG